MSQTKALVVLGLIMLLVVSSSGCTTPDMNSMNPWGKKAEKKIEVKVIGKEFSVQRGFNFTIVALVRNMSDNTYNATLTLNKLPKGFTGQVMNSTNEIKRARQVGCLVRLFVGDETNIGDYTVTVKGVFLEKKSESQTASIKVHVNIPSSGTVRPNDSVNVDYIGFLDNGEIFDTSVADVGQNTNIRKSTEWTGHGSTYSPLTATIDTGSVVQGFNDGIKSLELGQSRSIMVPPEKGYANFINVTINRTDHMPMVRTYGWNEFASIFGETPAENKVVTDKHWGWSVQVIDLKGNNATVMINPQLLLNKTVHPYGLDSKIVSINSQANNGTGEIVVENTYVPGQNVSYMGLSGKVVKTTDSIYIITYNSSTQPLSKKNMWFEITLVKINIS
jgi:FKBP-type peptidyl-prolyl cis-trans isomerase 2